MSDSVKSRKIQDFTDKIVDGPREVKSLKNSNLKNKWLEKKKAPEDFVLFYRSH